MCPVQTSSCVPMGKNVLIRATCAMASLSVRIAPTKQTVPSTLRAVLTSVTTKADAFPAASCVTERRTVGMAVMKQIAVS